MVCCDFILFLLKRWRASVLVHVSQAIMCKAGIHHLLVEEPCRSKIVAVWHRKGFDHGSVHKFRGPIFGPLFEGSYYLGPHQVPLNSWKLPLTCNRSQSSSLTRLAVFRIFPCSGWCHLGTRHCALAGGNKCGQHGQLPVIVNLKPHSVNGPTSFRAPFVSPSSVFYNQSRTALDKEHCLYKLPFHLMLLVSWT